MFARVDLYGVMGSEKVRAFDAERGRQVRRILRLDPLGLRRWLPQRLLYFAFAQLGGLVRRRAGRTEEGTTITAGDFWVVEESSPAALDLVALCWR